MPIARRKLLTAIAIIAAALVPVRVESGVAPRTVDTSPPASKPDKARCSCPGISDQIDQLRALATLSGEDKAANQRVYEAPYASDAAKLDAAIKDLYHVMKSKGWVQ